MKTKRIIYFLLIVLGALIMGFGKLVMLKEYALSIGIVFLMFGLYKTTQVWNIGNEDQNKKDDEKI